MCVAPFLRQGHGGLEKNLPQLPVQGHVCGCPALRRKVNSPSQTKKLGGVGAGPWRRGGKDRLCKPRCAFGHKQLWELPWVPGGPSGILAIPRLGARRQGSLSAAPGTPPSWRRRGSPFRCCQDRLSAAQSGSSGRRPRPHGHGASSAALGSDGAAGPARALGERSCSRRAARAFQGADGAGVRAPGGADDWGRGVSAGLRINANRTTGFVGGFLKALRWRRKAWETDFVYCSLRRWPPARAVAEPPLGPGPPCAPPRRSCPGAPCTSQGTFGSGHRRQLPPVPKQGAQAHASPSLLQIETKKLCVATPKCTWQSQVPLGGGCAPRGRRPARVDQERAGLETCALRSKPAIGAHSWEVRAGSTRAPGT